VEKKLDDEALTTELEAIFLREGYRDVTLRELARRLNCSYRRIYAIAPSKEGLFLFVMSNFFSRLKMEGWRRASADQPLVERIGEYLRVGVEYAHRVSVVCSEDIEGLEAGRIIFDSHQKERIGGLQEMLNEGIRSGQFGGYHPQLVAEVMVLAAKRLREPSFLAKSGMSFSEALDELSRLLRFGLSARDT
jgi:AcrR family transcriptional regulator